jgi:hypothetical protein
VAQKPKSLYSSGMNRNAISVLRLSIIVLLGVVIVSYASFQAWKIVSGPIVEIYSPLTGATYEQALIEVEGRARNIAYLNLNDRPIFTDKNGYFKEKIILSPGYNIIKLDARDKFKKYTEKRLEIILKEY